MRELSSLPRETSRIPRPSEAPKALPECGLPYTVSRSSQGLHIGVFMNSKQREQYHKPLYGPFGTIMLGGGTLAAAPMVELGMWGMVAESTMATLSLSAIIYDQIHDRKVKKATKEVQRQEILLPNRDIICPIALDVLDEIGVNGKASRETTLNALHTLGELRPKTSILHNSVAINPANVVTGALRNLHYTESCKSFLEASQDHLILLSELVAANSLNRRTTQEEVVLQLIPLLDNFLTYASQDRLSELHKARSEAIRSEHKAAYNAMIAEVETPGIRSARLKLLIQKSL